MRAIPNTILAIVIFALWFPLISVLSASGKGRFRTFYIGAGQKDMIYPPTYSPTMEMAPSIWIGLRIDTARDGDNLVGDIRHKDIAEWESPIPPIVHFAV